MEALWRHSGWLAAKHRGTMPQNLQFARFLEQERIPNTKLQIAEAQKHQILEEHRVQVELVKLLPMIERIERAPMNTKGSKRKRKAAQSQDKGAGKRFRVPAPSSDAVRGRMNFSDVESVSITDPYTQTWQDANSPENAIGAPDGSKQPWHYYAILDPKEAGVASARTISTKFLRYPERGRSGSMIIFRMDEDLFIADFCKCIQSDMGSRQSCFRTTC